ncbi:MAG: TonB-dependent receptor [Prevotella sp.]|uniref:SusC/RagA family TonB-linked outer membrane protein n=1 Tax=Leyella stercorea TaxID=363265 RepID=UPI0028022032|nr:TonB-dependent receptor [Leyella stercorea]MDY4197188.1 TonB-dependent receptor [Prevotella sp.]
MAQTHVSGIVTSSEDGEPVIGATVKVVGSQTAGTVTDIEGRFSLSVSKPGVELEFSSIGMVSKRVKASENMTVVLQVDSHTLEQVVITGYGSAKKLGSVVGSIASVDKKKLESIVTPNFTDALAGQVSGLSVLSGAGDPSQSATIRLRGINSIQSSSQPLFILDGAPIDAAFYATLNPADIESITVLKDAASTAIYGARAANGVIVLTSKQGKYSEQVSLSVRAQYGIAGPTSDGVEMMNSKQYVKFRDLIGQPVSDEVRTLVDKYNINTNWRDEMIDNAAPTLDVNATMQGGGQTVNYYISFNHHKQDGLIEMSKMHRNTLNARINARLNRFFKIGFTTNLGVQRYSQNAEWSATGAIYAANPLVFARKAMPFDTPYQYTIDENGKMIKGDRAIGLKYSGMVMPWWYNAHRNYYRNKLTLNTSVTETFTPLEGLTFQALQSINGLESMNHGSFSPYDAFVDGMGNKIDAMKGSVSASSSRYYQFTLSHTAEWRKQFGDHYVGILLGEETRIERSRGLSAYSEGQTDSRLLLLPHGTTVAPGDLGDSFGEEVANSLFANAEYNYKEKYYVTGSIRRDGSSKFAPGHRWGTFWSAGAKWDLKKEDFLKDVEWLNDLSLSVNYGTTGNDSGTGSYGYFGSYGVGGLYNGESSLGIASMSNPDLTWETTAKWNVGLNFSIFDRAHFQVDFYRNKSTDMLMSIPYSMTTGFSSGIGNVAAMTNTGVEANVDVDILKTKDFYWSFKANVGYNKNEITELFQGRDEYVLANTGLKMAVGHAYGEFYQVRFAGVDPMTGAPLYYDKDGNKTKKFNEERDAVFLGKKRYAPWTGGFGTNFRYKNVSLIADFAWVAGKYMMINDDYFIANPQLATGWNQRVEMLNIWTTPGQITDIPGAKYDVQFTDQMLQNASFLRMKTLSIQYEFPKKWMQATRYIKGVKVFGIARNLFTITPFEGYDPEPDMNLVQFNYPNTRQFVFGAEISF